MSSAGESGGGSGQRPRSTPPLLPGTGWTAHLVGFATAAMAFLAVMVLAAAIGASAVSAQWRADLIGVATVRLSTLEGNREERLSAVLEVLRTTPGIARVRPLSEDEQRGLVAPWLGPGADLEGLPMPQLVDVTLDGDGPDATALQQRLDLTVAGAIYDDHSAWRGPLANAADGLERLALVAAVLIFVTVAGIVAFAARATLIGNRSVVETLRLIGAEDAFIARAMVGRLVLRAAAGGVIGALLGCLAVLALPGIETDDPALSLVASPSAGGWAILALAVPATGVLVTWLAARTAIAVTLRGLP